MTAFDISMDRMVSLKKDCVSQAMSRRIGFLNEDRAQFVGLKSVGAVNQLSAGAHLFEMWC